MNDDGKARDMGIDRTSTERGAESVKNRADSPMGAHRSPGPAYDPRGDANALHGPEIARGERSSAVDDEAVMMIDRMKGRATPADFTGQMWGAMRGLAELIDDLRLDMFPRIDLTPAIRDELERFGLRDGVQLIRVGDVAMDSRNTLFTIAPIEGPYPTGLNLEQARLANEEAAETIWPTPAPASWHNPLCSFARHSGPCDYDCPRDYAGWGGKPAEPWPTPNDDMIIGETVDMEARRRLWAGKPVRLGEDVRPIPAKNGNVAQHPGRAWSWAVEGLDLMAELHTLLRGYEEHHRARSNTLTGMDQLDQRAESDRKANRNRSFADRLERYLEGVPIGLADVEAFGEGPSDLFENVRVTMVELSNAFVYLRMGKADPDKGAALVQRAEATIDRLAKALMVRNRQLFEERESSRKDAAARTMIREIATMTDIESEFLDGDALREACRLQLAGEPFTMPRLYSEQDRRRAADAIAAKYRTGPNRFETVNVVPLELVDLVAEALGMRRATR